MLELTLRPVTMTRRNELQLKKLVLIFDKMKALPTARCLICTVIGTHLLLSMTTRMSAAEQGIEDALPTAGMPEVEQRLEQLPTTAGTPELEQRMEQLPTTAGTPELEQRMEQLPTTAGTPEVEQRREQLPNDSVDKASGGEAGILENEGTDETSAEQNVSRRIKAHERFLFLHDEERYQEASAAGLTVVELTREEFGADHIRMVTPLVNLAITQAKNGDLPAAEANYKESILIIEKQEGVLSPRLINPLSGLGSTYNRAGLYEQGIEALERALLINHVNEGLYNFEQFKIQDGLTDSYTGMNALEDATFYQKAQVEIHQRKLGIGHPDVANSLYKLAKWYELIGNTEEAMLAYRKADRILRDAGGDTNAARVEALKGMAHIYERQAQPSSTASTLKKALEIIELQPEPDPLQRAKIQIALGDLYTRQGKFETSETHYLEAWQYLSRDDKYLDQRDEYFAEPVRVSGGSFSRLEFNSRGKPDSSLKDGFVLISYTVTGKGRTRDIKVIESEPPGLMDGSIISTYKRSLFRPSSDRRNRRPQQLTLRPGTSFNTPNYWTEKKDDQSQKEVQTFRAPDSERLEYPDSRRLTIVRPGTLPGINSMRAMAFHKAYAEIWCPESRPDPSPDDRDVLVKVEACGVCRTDYSHVQDAELPGLSYPIIPGHQVVGKVVEAENTLGSF